MMLYDAIVINTNRPEQKATLDFVTSFQWMMDSTENRIEFYFWNQFHFAFCGALRSEAKIARQMIGKKCYLIKLNIDEQKTHCTVFAAALCPQSTEYSFF